jgi:hypothetical protein
VLCIKSIINVNSVQFIMKQPRFYKGKETNINLTISSPISGVMLILLLLSLRASDVDAPSDL